VGTGFWFPCCSIPGLINPVFPPSWAAFFGHDNQHGDVQKDVCHGIGGSSTSYLHSVQISLLDPKKSTKSKPVVAWTAKGEKAAFIENLECEFGLIGMDLMSQWRSVTFEPNKFGVTIRIVI
jgi:hypothetical protein